MNIDNLTIDEIKQIQALLNVKNSVQASSLYQDYVGKYVICRSRNEGINAGIVKAIDETGVVLSDARRLWYHRPKNKNESWYEGVARNGISESSKVSGAVEKVIAEDFSLTICTEDAAKSIMEAPIHEQS